MFIIQQDSNNQPAPSNYLKLTFPHDIHEESPCHQDEGILQPIYKQHESILKHHRAKFPLGSSKTS